MYVCLYFAAMNCGIRTIELLSEFQHLKTRAQCTPYLEYIAPGFRRVDKSLSSFFTEVNDYNVFHVFNDQELVCNLYLMHEVFRNIGHPEKYDVLCMYSIYTNPKYRNQGYAKGLIKHALKYYKEAKNLDNFMVALHINPEDEMMNCNYAIYYAMGFKKGAIVNVGPTTYKYRYSEILKMKDVREVVHNIDTNTDEGKYLAMFCPYDKLFPNERIDMESMIEEGEWLREKLISRSKKSG